MAPNQVIGCLQTPGASRRRALRGFFVGCVCYSAACQLHTLSDCSYTTQIKIKQSCICTNSTAINSELLNTELTIAVLSDEPIYRL